MSAGLCKSPSVTLSFQENASSSGPEGPRGGVLMTMTPAPLGCKVAQLDGALPFQG